MKEPILIWPCDFTCQGCGVSALAIFANHRFHKPEGWFQRSDDDGPQVACSRKCIDIIAEKTGKTAIAMPF